MPIYKYQKHATAHTIICAALPMPENLNDAPLCTELCELDGYTYVNLPSGATIPDQPPEISLDLVTLTPALRSQIKGANPHCSVIAERMEQKIRDVYSVSDEAYFARIGVGAALGSYEFESGEMEALLAFGAHVESVRSWGRAERAKLGL